MSIDPTLPLAGVTVAEFCEVAAGPFCGMLLADLGADVVKIERPEGGDSLRSWPPLTEGFSENFASLNRNKRSIALDLKNEQDRALARALALSCDVVIENYRPGVMARWGLDAASLAPYKPTLVFCSISAFGQTGPRMTQGGFDLTIQAAAGVMSVTGEPGGPPVKCGVPIADFASGLYAALYVLAALRAVGKGEPARAIDVSMAAATLAVSALQTSQYFGTGRDPRALGSAHPRNAPYRAFEARDGYFVLAAGNDRLWKSVIDTLGRPDLAEAQIFRTTSSRAAHQEKLRVILEEAFAQRTVDDLVAAFTASGVPCGPVNTFSQALDDSQTAHLGLIQPLDLPGGARTRTLGPPVRLGGQTARVRRRPPALGEHGDEIRRDLQRAPQRLRPQRLRQFIREFTALIERTGDRDELITAEGAPLLAQLVAVDDWLPVEAAYCDRTRYQQHLLHCDPLERFSVVSFVWAPGQATPIHDHTVWGLVGVLRGEETCQEFRLAPGTARPTPTQSHVLKPGSVDVLLPAAGDIHQVTSGLVACPTVSIHVYGANIGITRRHSWDPHTHELRTFVSGYSNRLVPNIWG